jgi:hypothetical protein
LFSLSPPESRARQIAGSEIIFMGIFLVVSSQ